MYSEIINAVTFVHAEASKGLKNTNVVVVGGGYGGVAAAMKLKDHCNLTLIDSRNSFHHNMGAQRSTVEPGMCILLSSKAKCSN